MKNRPNSREFGDGNSQECNPIYIPFYPSFSPLKRYVTDKEPKPQSGIYKGLTVMLDLHTDYLISSSVDEDFQGFVGKINRLIGLISERPKRQF